MSVPAALVVLPGVPVTYEGMPDIQRLLMCRIKATQARTALIFNIGDDGATGGLMNESAFMQQVDQSLESGALCAATPLALTPLQRSPTTTRTARPRPSRSCCRSFGWPCRRCRCRTSGAISVRRLEFAAAAYGCCRLV